LESFQLKGKRKGSVQSERQLRRAGQGSLLKELAELRKRTFQGRKRGRWAIGTLSSSAALRTRDRNTGFHPNPEALLEGGKNCITKEISGGGKTSS